MAEVRIGVVIHKPLREQLFTEADRRRLEALGDVTWAESDGPLTDEQAIEILRDCDIAVGGWGTPVPSEEFLAKCPRLRLWEHAAGSVKHFFGPHLSRRGVTVASCAPANGENVAEFTLGLLIVGLKRVLPNAADNRRLPPPVARPTNARVLGASVIGIIGASQVGRHVMRMLRPFGPEILLYDPYVTDAEAAELGATRVDDLLELCRRSDAVSLHAPALPSTKHMLGEAQFEAMKDDAVFINTARGMIVDEDALVSQLQRGRLFAFLDVTWPEPAPADHPFRKLTNVVLTSHIAGLADIKFGRQAVEDIAAFLSGKSPLMVITDEIIDRVG